MQALYDRNTPSELLIVGHADAAGGTASNDKLSLERAETVADYLQDNVDGWLKWYGSGVPQAKRWGTKEDLAMLGVLPDAADRPPDEDPVRFFQRTRGLKLDGIAGPETRRALVEEYMALDQTTVPDGINITVHGCGENFLAVPTANGVSRAENRRAELFFFDSELGIQPPPSGKNSAPDATDYPEWQRRARLFQELTSQRRALVIKLLDALNNPLPFAPYELRIGDDVRTGEADENGLLHERDVLIPNRCTLRCEFPPDEDEDEDGSSDDASPVEAILRELILDYSDTDDSDRDEAGRRRLSNLGYTQPQLADRVRQFRRDFGLPDGSTLDQTTFDELQRIHDNP